MANADGKKTRKKSGLNRYEARRLRRRAKQAETKPSTNSKGE